jgi:hypothetical protein
VGKGRDRARMDMCFHRNTAGLSFVSGMTCEHVNLIRTMTSAVKRKETHYPYVPGLFLWDNIYIKDYIKIFSKESIYL